MRTLQVAAFAAICVRQRRCPPGQSSLFRDGDSLSIKTHRGGDPLLGVDHVEIGAVRSDRGAAGYGVGRSAGDERRLQSLFGGQRRVINEQYGDIIDQVSAKHNVDANLVKAMITVEAGYQSRARSRKGAMGLMQLMPATARRFNVKDPYNPQSNIEGGIKYLKTLLDRFPERLAIAAYNAGEAAVERFRGVPPYAETRDYVTRVLHLVGR